LGIYPNYKRYISLKSKYFLGNGWFAAAPAGISEIAGIAAFLYEVEPFTQSQRELLD
jgi:hypothetical protein